MQTFASLLWWGVTIGTNKSCLAGISSPHMELMTLIHSLVPRPFWRKYGLSEFESECEKCKPRFSPKGLVSFDQLGVGLWHMTSCVAYQQ